MNDNCCTPGGLPAPAAPGASATPFNICSGALPVVICGTAPTPVTIAPTPITLTGADCASAAVTLTATAGSASYAVQPAGHVYKVQLCAPGAQDRELVVLCKANGDKVSLQYDVLTTPPTLISQFNLNTNTVDATPLSALTQCGLEKLDYGSAVEYCAGGLAYTRIDVFDAQNQFVVGSIWQDEQGAQVAAPAGATLGRCSAQRNIGIYLERNTSAVTLADIVAATGSTQIMSVTVKQILGTGAISGDSGSGVPLSAGETWSWSASTGEGFQDMFNASALKLNAGGGEQRITATYVL